MHSFIAKNRFQLAAVFAYVSVIILLIIAITISTPSVEVISKGEPAAKLSAERVYDHLKEFAQKPRHPGTAYHEQARAYIADTIRALDVPVTIEKTTVAHEKKELPIHNIVATLEGTQPDKDIVIMAHYDSVEEGPGVNDDAVNVGVLIETLRVLKQEERLRNTVVFLFTDGEETGLHGAKEYVKRHSSENIGFVLNLEARGYKGPMLLFETSGPNGKAIQLFNEHVSNPYAFSFFEDLYRYLPHDTDLTPFKKKGVLGLNFAYVEGSGVYHTKYDNLNHVHLPTVQHSGQYALSMVKALGSYDLTAIASKENYAFFNVFGNYLMIYPVAWNGAFTALALLLFAAAILYGWNKGIVQIRKSMKWTIFVIASIIIIHIFGTFFYIAYSVYDYAGVSSSLFICLIIITLLSLFIYWLLWRLRAVFRMKLLIQGLSVIDMVVGAMLLMAVLTVWTMFAMPGSHYLTAFPLMVCSISLLGYFLMHRFISAYFIFSIIAAMSLTLILYPFIRLVAIGFGVAGIHYLLILLLLYIPLIVPAFLNTRIHSQ